MNDPFEGVYQIKRSSAAAYLLQIKWLIANQPYGEDVKFDTRGLAPVFDVEEMNDNGERTGGSSASETGNNKSTASEAVTDLKQAVTFTAAADSSFELQELETAMKSSNDSIHKVASATDFLPAQRQTSAKVDTRFQSNTTQEESLTSQFESVSGFPAVKKKDEEVAVTTRMWWQRTCDKVKPIEDKWQKCITFEKLGALVVDGTKRDLVYIECPERKNRWCFVCFRSQN